MKIFYNQFSDHFGKTYNYYIRFIDQKHYVKLLVVQKTSQHAKGQAADFEIAGTDNAELFDWIQNNVDFDQLILEFFR